MNTQPVPVSHPAFVPYGDPCPWLADESPLNDLDDAEDSIDDIEDDMADALAELQDEGVPFADPGEP